jgi:hypothetical protein
MEDAWLPKELVLQTRSRVLPGQSRGTTLDLSGDPLELDLLGDPIRKESRRGTKAGAAPDRYTEVRSLCCLRPQ